MSLTDVDDFSALSPQEAAAMEAQFSGQDFDPDTFVDPGPGPDALDSPGGEAPLDDGAGDGTGAGNDDAPGAGGQPQQRQQQARQQEQPGEEDEIGIETVNVGGKQQKRVSFHKYQRLQQQFEEAQRKLNETATMSAADKARLEERLSIINDALATPRNVQQQEHQPQEDARPDPRTDIFAYADWADRQITRMNGVIEELRTGQQQRQETEELGQTYREQAAEFAQKEPTFVPAYKFLMAQRMNELLVPHLQFDANNNPLPVPPQIRRQVMAKVAKEEQGLVRKAIADGVNPAARLFQMAKARGFVYTPPQQQQRQQNGAGAGGRQVDPNALDAAGAHQRQPQRQQPGNGAQRPAAQQRQAPTADQIIDHIENGQKAGVTLSGMGGAGGAVGMQLTAQELVNMKDEEFADLMDRLSETQQRELLGD